MSSTPFPSAQSVCARAASHPHAHQHDQQCRSIAAFVFCCRPAFPCAFTLSFVSGNIHRKSAPRNAGICTQSPLAATSRVQRGFWPRGTPFPNCAKSCAGSRTHLVSLRILSPLGWYRGCTISCEFGTQRPMKITLFVLFFLCTAAAFGQTGVARAFQPTTDARASRPPSSCRVQRPSR